MSIPEIKEWIETNQKNLVLGSVIFLIATICFALGYLYRGETQRAQIVVQQNDSASAKTSVGETKKVTAKVVPPKPVIPPPVTIVYEPVPPPVLPIVPTHPAVVIQSSTVAVPVDLPPTTLAVIVITEVTAGTEASGDDEFIELYNSNSVAVDLTGYSIKKRTSGGSESSLVSATRLQGKSIPAGKHFLIAHDQGYLGSVAADANWAKSNGLAYKNNVVILYNASGAKLSEVSWTELTKGQSTAGAPSPQNSLF